MREAEGQVVEIGDERDPLAEAALELIRHAIGDVQPVDDLLSELEERRRGLKSGGEPHLFALVEDGAPVAVAAGVYLETVNAGFVTYLAVDEHTRGRMLGRRLRAHLVDAFRADAQSRGRELAWTVGEVRRESPWLRSLVRHGEAIPFGFSYFHPWQPQRSEGRYVLYREPVTDHRAELPAQEVLSLVYAIWRRAYRIRFPLQSDTFCYMLDQLETRVMIGVDEAFASEMGKLEAD
ncbi:MAG TPA: GNAT family N-acetyltransferase [Longimicrobiaceae bacterium]|jgi:N-acetylglutamate synthase-like GNAT family acetyltransferase|nr:GNAT family N-acetyltransferase [Longimicrobiaceae bacterium]